MAKYSYPLILKELSDDKVGVSFPDIKELRYESDSIGKVCLMAKEALTEYIKKAVNDGAALPNATPNKSIKIAEGELIIIIDVEI